MFHRTSGLSSFCGVDEFALHPKYLQPRAKLVLLRPRRNLMSPWQIVPYAAQSTPVILATDAIGAPGG